MNEIYAHIVGNAQNNKKLSLTAKELNYSPKQINRYCKSKFNRTYKELQFLLISASILRNIMNKQDMKTIANLLFDGNVSQLYAYVNKFSDTPPCKIILTEGGHRMTQWQKKIFEAQVITKLATSTTNLTLKQLGVPRCIIQSLRLAGYDIISVPGRYNGGYNLSKSSKSNCINWINNIRVNRYGLNPNFTF